MFDSLIRTPQRFTVSNVSLIPEWHYNTVIFTRSIHVCATQQVLVLKSVLTPYNGKPLIVCNFQKPFSNLLCMTIWLLRVISAMCVSSMSVVE